MPQLKAIANVFLVCIFSGQICRIGTVCYAESLWRMRRHGPVIAHCTDSEDFSIFRSTFSQTIAYINAWFRIYADNISKA